MRLSRVAVRVNLYGMLHSSWASIIERHKIIPQHDRKEFEAVTSRDTEDTKL